MYLNHVFYFMKTKYWISYIQREMYEFNLVALSVLVYHDLNEYNYINKYHFLLNIMLYFPTTGKKIPERKFIVNEWCYNIWDQTCRNLHVALMLVSMLGFYYLIAC